MLAKKPNSNKPKPTEAEVDRLISGGLDKKPSAPAASQAPKNHPLRFPADGELFARLEAALNAAPVKPARNTYIIQAIKEKLDRDEKNISD